MRLHFRSESTLALQQSHPSYFVVLDAHPMPPRIEGAMQIHRKTKQQRQEDRQLDPADDDEPSKNALHISSQERPHRRQFFRLRHRGRSTDESKSLSPPPERRRSPSRSRFIRKPNVPKRTMSLPRDLKAAEAPLTQSCPAPKRGHRRTVTFSNVQVREYVRILGDHPCCPSGPPLSLGWETERESQASVEEYERHRPRRSKEDFRLGCEVRREILEGLTSSHSSEEEGETYSRAEIRRAERRLNRERAENRRVVRKRNNRFFGPVEGETGEPVVTAEPEPVVRDAAC